jgi:hypothetical protein
MNDGNLIEIIKVVFKKIAICSWEPCEEPIFLELECSYSPGTTYDG